MALIQAFQTSIGKKLVMGFTGLFLISFLVIHATVNGMIFFNDNGAMFNEWAKFMSHNWIVRFLELGLFAGFVLHIIQGFSLTLKNQKTRNTKYAVNPGNATSKWYSRSMGILGSLLLIFLCVHKINLNYVCLKMVSLLKNFRMIICSYLFYLSYD